jgi:Ca2+-binding EF-hand superfamily protein
LIPGFGEEEFLDLIPGFGPLGETLNVELEQADREEAQQTMRRYDRNRDGILSAEEIRQGRWRDNPLAQDRNGDGKLTLTELSARYSIRRSVTQEREKREAQARENQQASSSRGGSDRRGGGQTGSSRWGGGQTGSSRGGGQTGSSRGGGQQAGSSRWGGGQQTGGRDGSSGGADRMAAFADSIFQRYDTNKSGSLEKDEWKNFRTDPSAADTNKSGRISKEELSKWMSNRFSQARGGESGNARGGSSGRDGSRSAGSSGAGSGSYRFLMPQERLPEGLPEWYRSRDKDLDGQIRMSEFSTSQWTEQTLSDYYKFDLNRDGVISPAECLAAVEKGAVSSGSSSRGSSRDRGGDSARSDRGSASNDAAKPAAGDGKIDPRYMSYAVGKIREQDFNKDGVLSKEEWSRSSSFNDAMDADKDGKLTPTEYAQALIRKR